MFDGAHLSQMFGKILKCAPSMFRWGTIESNTKVFAKKNIITTFACFRSTASINTSQMCPLKSFVPPGMPAVPGRLMDRAPPYHTFVIPRKKNYGKSCQFLFTFPKYRKGRLGTTFLGQISFGVVRRWPKWSKLP